MSVGGDFKLTYQIRADADQARRELNDVDRLINKTGAGLSSLAGPASVAAAGVAAIGAAAVAGGIALFNLTKQASDYGSTIFDASKKTGLSAEALSAMKFAAEQSGTSLEAITGGVAKFSKTVGEAADGSEKAAAKLKEFGLEPLDAINDLDGALDKVFKRIIEAPPGIERMTLAQKAFGKSGADLLPFLDSFGGDLNALRQKAKELGVTIDDKAAKAADDFGDQLDTLNNQLAGVGRTIGTELMPTFTSMATKTSEWLVRNKSEVHAWAEVLGTAFAGATSGLGKFVDFIRNNATWIRVGLGVATMGLSEASIRAGEGLAALTIAEGHAVQQGGGGGAAGGRGYRRSGTDDEGGGGEKKKAAGEKKKINTITVGRADNQATVTQAAIANAELVMNRKIAIFDSGHDVLYSIGLRFAADEKKTEEELARHQEQLEEGKLEHRKTKLLDYLRFLKTLGPEAVEEFEAAEHELKLLEDEIEKTRNTNAANERRRKDQQIADEKRLAAERQSGWEAFTEQLREAIKLQQQLGAESSRKAYESATVMGGTGIGGAIGQSLGVGLVPMFDESTNAMLSFQDRMAMVHQDINKFVGNAIGGLIDGLASMAVAWLTTGEFSAKAALQMAAGVALSVAMQAGIKAVFEVAEGFAALARYDPVSAGMHFAAAKVYGVTAAIAGGAGVALGLAGRAMGGGDKSSGGGSGPSGNNRLQDELNPYSRQSNNAFLSGRSSHENAVAKAIEKLNDRLDSMKPGDVLTVGMRQKRGVVGRQVVEDVKSNASIGTSLRRTLGGR